MAVVFLALCAWLYLRREYESIASSSASTRESDIAHSSANTPPLVDPLPVASLRREVDDPTEPSPESPATNADVNRIDVEVNVLDNEQPQIGVLVTWYRDEVEGSGFLIDESRGPAVAQMRTDGTGSAAFYELRSGRYSIAIGETDTETCRRPVLLTGDEARMRIVLALGTAGLEGRVFDYEGRLARGVRVVARQTALEGESALWFIARTDADGAYRMGGLAGGKAHEIAAMALDFELGTTLRVQLTPGEWRAVDLGTPAGRARWTGTLLCPSGTPLVGPGRLYFVLRGGASSEQGYFDSAGRFDATLPGGLYEARLSSPQGVLLGVMNVFGEVSADLVLPAAVLRGRITYTGTKHPFARGPVRELVIALERTDGRALSTSLIRGEETYGFCGLEPGSYVLTTRPWILVGTSDGRLPVDIAVHPGEVVIDLAVTDP